jgi:hypothetical protein
MAKDKAGHSVEFVDFWDEDKENIYWQYRCSIENKNVIVTESKGKEEEEGDFATHKPKHRKCPECGGDMELCDDCSVHHHTDTFMGEHNRYQTMVHPMREPTAEENAFREKYGTLFPHPKDLLPEDRPQDTGPQGEFYGDATYFPQGSVEPKDEAIQSKAYVLTPDEFNLITQDAWENNCEECMGVLQNIEEKDGVYNLYPTFYQTDHLQKLFGYSADPSMTPTGYLDPESQEWQKSVEHIQRRQQEPSQGGAFGPQSGMMRGEPTRDEWQVTSYLDELGVPYVHKMKLGELDPTEEKAKIEYDIYIPDYLIAIETSPGWHEGGPHAANFPQVTENDKYKRNFAKEHGIDLVAFDPAEGTEKFINEILAPKLRAVGVKAFEVHGPEEKKGKEEETNEREVYSKDRTCPFCGSKESWPINLAETDFRCEKCNKWFKSQEDIDRWLKSEEAPFTGDEWWWNYLKDDGDGVIVCKICDWAWLNPTMNDFQDHFERKADKKHRNTLDEPSGWEFLLGEEKEEAYVNRDCPVCGEPFIAQELAAHIRQKHPDVHYDPRPRFEEDGHYPDEGKKGQGFERGNPFNQQFIYREDSRFPVEIRKAGYDFDYNVKYRKKPILEEQGQEDRFVHWTDEPYNQKSVMDSQGEPICISCSEGRHPHEGSDCKVIIPQGQCCCMFGIEKDWKREQSPPVNQNIPTGAYETVTPLEIDQSQNYPLHPSRGKVNTIDQGGNGEEYEATNNLFMEEEDQASQGEH